VANIIPFEKKVAVISTLAEGQSIRATERMLGIHRDTIMRIGVRVAQGCERLLNSMMPPSFQNSKTARIEEKFKLGQYPIDNLFVADGQKSLLKSAARCARLPCPARNSRP
jgi:hypothetical protein